MRGYLPLIRKDSSTHMHHLAVYVKEGLPFARDLSPENSADSHLLFDWLYFTQCLTSSSSVDHLRLCARFLILFHLTSMSFSRSTHYTRIVGFQRSGFDRVNDGNPTRKTCTESFQRFLVAKMKNLRWGF